jgi:O-succinylbenzoic acid--CoA ligase
VIGAWLPRAATAFPERPAVQTERDGAVTYAELHARAATAARRLAARGVRRGDRVGLVLDPGMDFVATFHGCLLLGAAALPADPRLPARELAARTSTATVMVDEPLQGAEASTTLDSRHDLDAVAAVIHTSGTSGEPRPVELTYGNWLWSAFGSALALGLDRRERWLCALPLDHVGGLSIVVRSAIYATTAVVHAGFDAERVAAALTAGAATLVSLVPTTLDRVLAALAAPPCGLRCALIGGAPLDGALARRATDAGVPAAQTYGLTEACSQVTTSQIGEPGTAGVPLAPTRLEIAADGEILVAGPTVAPGAVAPDGRLHTGDLGRLDDRGRLTVVGRTGDLIISGGENVSPAEVEAVLAGHPAVAEAAVAARPDPEWGQAVVATVVLRDGAAAGEDELRAHCAARLAPAKVPKAVVFATALPRTASGKLLRRAVQAGPAGGPRGPLP